MRREKKQAKGPRGRGVRRKRGEWDSTQWFIGMAAQRGRGGGNAAAHHARDKELLVKPNAGGRDVRQVIHRIGKG